MTVNMSAVPPAVNSTLSYPGETMAEEILGTMTLDQLRGAMRSRGVRRMLVKFLAANDNSKNQVYLGGDLSVVNVLPADEPVAASSGSHAEPIFKARLDFAWLDDQGSPHAAPNAQLILYPQYPEVRFSGFLRGASAAPSDAMASRALGRLLILGITGDRRVIGYASTADSPLAKQLKSTDLEADVGVFRIVPMTPAASDANSRASLLAELCRIHRAGPIVGWRLGANNETIPCTAPNCVGVTLESELGIVANSNASPDYLGWEVKAHSVARLDRPKSGTITLMTPEPSGGLYKTEGVAEFVREFGYPDKQGRPDRLNFGGIHAVGVRTKSTGLRLALSGYDSDSSTLLKADGELALLDDSDRIAASWSFPKLLGHWQRKHAKAAYVPAIRATTTTTSYQYGSEILLCEGTDFLRLLRAIADGSVYYDPGIKLENASGAALAKRRSQIRIAFSRLPRLYLHTSEANACA